MAPPTAATGSGPAGRAAGHDETGAPTSHGVGVPWRAASLGVAAGLGIAIVAASVGQAPRPTELVAVSLVAGLALGPLIDALARRLSIARRTAAVIVLTGALATVVVLLALVAADLARAAKATPDEVLVVLDDLTALPLVGDRLRDAEIPERAAEALGGFTERLGGEDADLRHAADRTGAGAGQALVAALIVVGVVADGPRLVLLVRRAVPPEARGDADDVGRLLSDLVVHGLAGRLLLAALAATAVAVVSAVLDLPLGPVLAAWAALCAMVPRVGLAVGVVTASAVAATEGALALLVTTLTLGAGAIAARRALVPTLLGPGAARPGVVGSAVAVVAGYLLGGVTLALVAVPIAGAALTLVDRRTPPPGRDGARGPETTP